MSVVANVAINVDASKALQQIKGFDAAVNNLGGASKGLGGQLGELAAKLGIAAGAAVLFNKSFDAIRGMDQAVAKVKTLGVNTEELVPKLAAVSRELKGQVSTAELTAAAYDVASAGYANAADNANILRAAALGAVGGFSDVNTVADAATSILNAYGRSAGDAGLIVDQLVQTQNDGKTTVDEYAKSLGRIIPTASAAGIGIEEINAGVATLTAKGIVTNEAVTGLNQAIAGIIKPTSEAEKMASSLGIEFNAAALKSKGLGGVLGDVQKATGGSVEKMSQLFGSVEALKAVLGLTSDDLGVFNKNLKNQASASGVAKDASNVMSNTIEGAFKRISTAFENMLTETQGLGGSIATILNGVAFVIESLSFAFNLLPGPLRTAVVGFTLLAVGVTAVAVPLGIVLPLLQGLAGLKIGATIAGWAALALPAVTAITTAFTGLMAFLTGTVLPGLIAIFSGPVGWTALAVAAVVAMVVLFRKPITDFLVWLGNSIGTAFNALMGMLYPVFVQPFIDLWNNVLRQPVTSMFNWIGNFMSNSMKTAFRLIYQVFVEPFVVLWKKVLRKPVTNFVNWVERTLGAIAGFFADKVVEPIYRAWEVLTGFLSSAITLAADTARSVWNDFASWFNSTVVQPISKFWNGLIDGIVSRVQSVRNAVVSIWSNIVSTITGGIVAGVRGVIGATGRIINSIIGGLNKLIAGINKVRSAVGLSTFSMVPEVNMPSFAKGGVVNGPTVALVGDGGEPEYIIPASKMAAASANYLNGARGGSVIPAMAEGGYVGSGAQINVTTGPVMQQGGQRYVTLTDLEKAMRQTADGIYASLRTSSGRYAIGAR